MLCFVVEGEAADREMWEGGEVGGYEAYLLADEDNEAAEVYKAVSGGEGQAGQQACSVAGAGWPASSGGRLAARACRWMAVVLPRPLPSQPLQAQDDESGVLNVSPGANTLSLVLRDEGLMRFVKFLSVQAPSSRFDISAIYEPEPDSDED